MASWSSFGRLGKVGTVLGVLSDSLWIFSNSAVADTEGKVELVVCILRSWGGKDEDRGRPSLAVARLM